MESSNDCGETSPRLLQSTDSTTSPTSCMWENYNIADVVAESPYCDNIFVKYQDTFYRSTLSAVDELTCNRNMNWINTADFILYNIPSENVEQDEMELWCINKNEGYGVFYQKYASTNEQKCGVYTEDMEGGELIYHGWHAFGGVCLPSHLMSEGATGYIENCSGDISPSIESSTIIPTPAPTTASPTHTTAAPTDTTAAPTHMPTVTNADGDAGDDGGGGGYGGDASDDVDEGGANLASYIIGTFNMIIAILSALHTFLKYDALEDRHHQYSRHFGNLKLDIETLLCKPMGHRGDPTSIMENFKTKYSVLMNNAPDLPSRLEQNCMDMSSRTIVQGGIELT